MNTPFIERYNRLYSKITYNTITTNDCYLRNVVFENMNAIFELKNFTLNLQHLNFTLTCTSDTLFELLGSKMKFFSTRLGLEEVKL